MKTATCLVLIVVHVVLITAVMVLIAFRAYPNEGGHAVVRRINLQTIHKGMLLYKQETGGFPDSLNSYLRYDSKSEEVSSILQQYGVSDDLEMTRVLRYQLLGDQPILCDLGSDGKEDGLGLDMDVVYPEKYQDPFPFGEFTKTGVFLKSLVIGLVFGSGISVCLYGILRKRATTKPISLFGAILFSVLLLLFELALASTILFAHIYPHH